PPCPWDYYVAALDAVRAHHAEQGLRLAVFSDDLAYCRSLPWDKRDDVVLVDKGSDWDQLCWMQAARDHVIANSTFSWWGAYARHRTTDGVVVAPARWFGLEGPASWSTLYAAGWIVI